MVLVLINNLWYILEPISSGGYMVPAWGPYTDESEARKIHRELTS